MSDAKLLGQPVEVIRTDGGRAVLRGRLLTTSDVDAVLALHLHVVRAMPAELVATETRTFFVDHADRNGRLLGLFDDDGLVAYSVLGMPGPGDPNFGIDHGLATQALARVAHLDGAAVHPSYRGNGLQRRMIAWRLAAARAEGRTIALSTVAPGNAASLASMLSEGLQVRALANRFGGLRFLMRRDLDGHRHGRLAPPGVEAIERWVPVDAVQIQKRLLGQGWIGLALRRAPATGLEIGYRRSEGGTRGSGGMPAGSPDMNPRSRQ